MRKVSHKTPRSVQKDQNALGVVQKESKKLFLRLVFWTCLLVATVGFVLITKQQASAPSPKQHFAVAALGGHPFQLDIANTAELRAQGLSNRPRLSDKEGMLFEYQQPDPACFWMKDMRFNLDILWFDADKKLIYQQQNLSSDTYPQNFCPPGPAMYVVEIKPGIIQLKIGDPLVLQKQ